MGATREPKNPAPNMGGEAAKETHVVNADAMGEPHIELHMVPPDVAQDATADNVSHTFPTPPTGAQDVPDGWDDEPDDGGSPKYPAQHFFKSNWYSHKRGELENLLEKDKEYSYAQVERMLSRQ